MATKQGTGNNWSLLNFHIKPVISLSGLFCIYLFSAATSAIEFPHQSKWPQSFKKYVSLKKRAAPSTDYTHLIRSALRLRCENNIALPLCFHLQLPLCHPVFLFFLPPVFTPHPLCPAWRWLHEGNTNVLVAKVATTTTDQITYVG